MNQFDPLEAFTTKLWCRHLREPNRKKRRRMRKWFNHLARRLLRMDPRYNIEYMKAGYPCIFLVSLPNAYQSFNTGPTPK